MPALVTEADIAVIPIDLSDPVAQAKPENKLMILWRLGMPVIASATRPIDVVWPRQPQLGV